MRWPFINQPARSAAQAPDATAPMPRADRFFDGASLVLLAVGVFLRLWRLGHAAFPADAMDFYRLALRNASIPDLWRHPPWLNQIPLNETFALLMVKAGLPPTPFVVRLPFAIMGILTLLLVWRFARRHVGSGAATVCLCLAVFNPYQLYFARTAYHYAGVICGSAAMLMGFWQIRADLLRGRCPSLKSVIGWLIVALLACHMHMSVWAVAGLQGTLLVVIGWHALRHDRDARRRYLIRMGCAGVVIVAVMSRWMFRALRMLSEVTDLIGAPAGVEYRRVLPAYFAGETWSAIGLLTVFAAITLSAVVAAYRRRRMKVLGPLAWITAMHALMIGLYVGLAGGGVAKISYFSALWPLSIWFLGIGLWQGMARAFNGQRWLQAGAIGVALGAYLGLTLPPAWAIVNLDGKPMPTHKINAWILDNLPPGTPILVDRWFHPWNELAIHNSQRIEYTFTVPDEPVETYRQLNWRDTVERFFAQFPEAALLEVNRDKYRDTMGPWRFPDRYFARHAAITNLSAMTLRRYKVFPTLDFADGNTNQVVSRIYYNTLEDRIVAAHRAHRRTLLVAPPDWRYVKPWQPMPHWPESLQQTLWIQAGIVEAHGSTVDVIEHWKQLAPDQEVAYLNRGRWVDYRAVSGSSRIRGLNLTDKPVNTRLDVSAIALSGAATATIGGVSATFEPMRLMTRSIALTLHPGENRIPFILPRGRNLLIKDLRLVDTMPDPLPGRQP